MTSLKPSQKRRNIHQSPPIGKPRRKEKTCRRVGGLQIAIRGATRTAIEDIKRGRNWNPLYAGWGDRKSTAKFGLTIARDIRNWVASFCKRSPKERSVRVRQERGDRIEVDRRRWKYITLNQRSLLGARKRTPRQRMKRSNGEKSRGRIRRGKFRHG